ncbi:MAG: L-serine ammonia-lyase, iron-sulfur-dependent, subunit beta [Clostridiales bacterium]|nr:L-serine ammonia-lyase, iron-sulfur-dependent, subunit beta [Clostridiales bacterium]
MNLFDIIGPIMIGPSSSHTAGAARIGRVARQLLGETPVEARVFFHGSFEKTYQGHGTDRAVAGGLMDMGVDDERLRDSLQLAEEAGLRITFQPIKLRDAHPNTVLVHLTGEKGKTVQVQAASIGGGSIRVQYLDGLEVGFSGARTTLIIRHTDAPGAIAMVTHLLSNERINIATMRVFRREAGGQAIMAIELDERPPQSLLSALKMLPTITDVTLLDQI